MAKRIKSRVWRLIASAACAASIATSSLAQQDVAAFYKGRQINMLIGSAAGGGYDAYARLIARHLDKYIPGHPAILPVNMPGAGGNTAAAHLYTLPDDGTAMAAIQPGSITKPLYAEAGKIKYDYTRLIYLGSANTEVDLCWARADAPVKSYQDAFSRELILGASGEGDSTHDFATAEDNILGTRFRIITGYSGTRDVLLALDRNEVQGVCGLGLPGMMAQRPDWVGNGFVRMLAQNNATGSPKLTRLGVPLTADFARTAEDRQALGLIYAQQQFGRPFVLPPGVPPERIAALRQAFMDALQDPDLAAEADRMKLDISPLSGQDLQALIGRIYATPPAIIERARSALVYSAPR
jgi:tripartite-type tricarboxylate transporter receptor subunit TctC